MSTTEEDLRKRYGLDEEVDGYGLSDVERMYYEADQIDRLNYGNEINEQADRASRILNVTGRTGLPFDLVSAEGALEDLEEKIRKEDFNPKQWIDESPIFAEFASRNPYHLAVLRRDEENLGFIERNWRPFSLAVESTKAKVEMNQIWNRRAMGVEYHQDGDMERIEELEKMVQDHAYGADNFLSRAIVHNLKEVGPMAYIMWEGKEEAMAGATAGALIGGKTGGAAGTMLAPGPGTLIGSGSGATAGFFTGGGIGWSVGSAEASFEMMRGEQYGRFIRAGFSHEEAARVSTWTGAISTLPELTGIGKLIKHVPGVGRFTDFTSEQIAKRLAGDVLAKQSVARATGALARRYGTGMAWEVGTEIFQDSVATVGQNYLASTTGKADANVTWDQYVDDVAHTAYATMRGMSIIAGIGPGVTYISDYRAARRAQDIEQTMTSLAEHMSDSKVRTEAPETYRKFVEEVASRKGGGPHINANAWDQFWQSNNQDPEAMAQRFGIDAEELQLSRELDMDIAIPAVPFAEQLAPSTLFDKILPDLKWEEGGMSPRERDLFNANKPKIIQDLEASLEKMKEADTQIDAMNIIEEVTGELIAADFDAVTSRHLAQLYRGFGVVADQLDMDPQELFDKFYGGVRRVTPEALARSNIKDPMIDPLINRLRRDDYPTMREQHGASLMDMIKEIGGIDPRDPELAAMDFELGAMDLGLPKAELQRWREGGRLVSDVAEIAAERGYIPDYDENLLLAAVSRELSGEQVFGTRDEGDPEMRRVAHDMDMLAQMVSALGLDLSQMSNEQVRAALEAADTFDQELAGKELRDFIEMMVRNEEEHGKDANEVDTLLARWSSLQPLILGEQDFADVEITDTVTLEETGEQLQITEDAAIKLERVQRRRNVLKKLLECVSG